MKSVELLNVYYAPEISIKVGRIALVDRKIYFEYDEEFLERNLQLSPFHLPNRKGVFFGPDFFEFLPGLFNDSLPDGWERLLLDRKLQNEGLSFRNLTPLDRLAFVGGNGMGALTLKISVA